MQLIQTNQNKSVNSLTSFKETCSLGSVWSFLSNLPSYLSAFESIAFKSTPQTQDKMHQKTPKSRGQYSLLSILYKGGMVNEPITDPSLATEILVPIAKANSLSTNHLLTIVPLKEKFLYKFWRIIKKRIEKKNCNNLKQERIVWFKNI